MLTAFGAFYGLLLKSKVPLLECSQRYWQSTMWAMQICLRGNKMKIGNIFSKIISVRPFKCWSKFWLKWTFQLKMENLVKNGNLVQKWKFWSKMEILVKNGKQYLPICFAKCRILESSRRLSFAHCSRSAENFFFN